MILAGIGATAAVPHGGGRTMTDRLLAALLEALVQTDVAGREHIPSRGRFIVAANHTSHLDGPLLRLAARPIANLHLAAAREVFWPNPLLRWLVVPALNLIPVDRRGREPGGPLAACRRLVQSPGNGGLVFFPEGTRSRDGAMHPFRRGIAVLAETGVPVLPAWIDGTARLMPPGARYPRTGRARIRFGAPVQLTTLLAIPDRQTRRWALTRHVEDAVTRLRHD
jgi:1-acyl-sn-glycerol-3-phosphate acyltransferase